MEQFKPGGKIALKMAKNRCVIMKIGDWVFGVGGRRLKATGKCVFAMKVTRTVTFNEYWQDPEFRSNLSKSRSEMWKDQNFREKRSISIKKTFSDPVIRKKFSDNSKAFLFQYKAAI